MQLYMNSFSVGQSIQGLNGTYRDNIHKFIVYIQLILKSLFMERLRVHMPDDLPDAGRHECNRHLFKY